MARPPANLHAVALAGSLAILVYAGLWDAGAPLYDDAYFFKRFALNFLDDGVFAWNVADGPVHGLTSQLYMLVATALAAVTREHWVLAVRGSALACLAVTSWLLLRPLRSSDDEGAVGPGTVALALTSAPVVTTLHSGMETALALALTAVGLLAAHAARPGRGAAATVLLYLCRPDAALVAALAFATSGATRRDLVRYVGLVGLGLAVWGLAAQLYYGSALPLPFFMKTAGLSPYGEAVVRIGRQVKLEHAATWLAFAAPALWLLARGAERRALSWAAPALGLVAYHLLLTNEIMGYRARFYVPALLPVAIGGALASTRAMQRTGRMQHAAFLLVWGSLLAVAYTSGLVARAGNGPAALPWSAYAGHLVGVAWLLLGPRSHPTLQVGGALVPVAAAALLWMPPVAIAWPDDAANLARARAAVTTARGADDLARCLPAGATVYHSEMGAVGLSLPRARLVDLAGLLSMEVAEAPHRIGVSCLRERPEAIFLPHENYRALNRSLEQSGCLGSYVRVVERSSSPLHVRQDLAPAFLRCAREVWRFQREATRARLQRLAKRP